LRVVLIVGVGVGRGVEDLLDALPQSSRFIADE